MKKHACGLKNGMAVKYIKDKLYIVGPYYEEDEYDEDECFCSQNVQIRFCPTCGHDAGEIIETSDICCKCEKTLNEQEVAVVNEDIKICKNCVRDLSDYF